MRSKIIRPDAADYPAAMALVCRTYPWARPPPALAYVGHFRSARGVAIVGSRNASPGGAKFARELARAVATQGWTVWSGGAKGIDIAAHLGAIDAGGYTVSVVTGRFDEPHPKSSEALNRKILRARGALLTLAAQLKMPRHRAMFLRRNHVMAALSDATIVIEASSGRSGSMAMGRSVLKIGRPLFTPLHPPWSGCPDLVSEGAIPITSVDHAITLLTQSFETPCQPITTPELGADAHRVLDVLNAGPSHRDDLCIAADLSPQRLSKALLMLKLNARIKTTIGGAIQRCEPG